MQATTLEEAAERLLAPAPSEKIDGDDNLDDSVDLITDTEESPDEQEVFEAATDDESADDLELDDDDLDETDEAEDTTLYTVLADGKEEQWTLDQLKQSASGTAAINRRFQEAAEMRKQIESQAQALEQQKQQVMQLYQQAQSGAFHQPKPPSREMFDSDPIGYMEAKLRYDDEMGQYQQQTQQVAAMQQQRTQAQEAARAAYLEEQAEQLQRFIPEFADPEKGAKLKNDLIELGSEYGFSREEMEGVGDARYVRALNDARKYRALMKSRKKAQQKSGNARPVVPAGAKKRQDGEVSNRKKAQQRLQKTGSIDDALGLILGS